MTTNEESRLVRTAALFGKLAGTLAHPQTRTSEHADTHFESSDISGRNVVLVGVGLFFGVWLFIGVMYFYFNSLVHQRMRGNAPAVAAAGRPEALPPMPRLQQSPHRDLKAYQAREDWELNNYHWVDQSKGIAAIPIEDATKIVARRGIPPQHLAPNATLTPPQEGSQLTGFEGKVEPEPR